MACIRDHGLASQGHPPKCGDPCPGACGQNAQCRVKQHSPFCTCLAGYEGDPFTGCSEIRDELYKNRSSRKIYSRRLFSREYDFWKTFSLTENQFSGRPIFTQFIPERLFAFLVGRPLVAPLSNRHRTTFGGPRPKIFVLVL